MPRRGEVATTELAAGALTAAGAEEAGALLLGAAASTSSFRMRPPIPVPLTDARFTPNSEASLRTIGVT